MTEKTLNVDCNKVAKKILNSGDEIPVVGLGTFGSDKYSNEEIANAVRKAIRLGYRHIDCASVYGNEKEIGEAFKDVIDEGTVKREDLWITSKLWNDRHHDVVAACKESLRDLQLEYLDLYLVHWPFPNFHAKGVSVDSRDPSARPYIHEEFMEVWRDMELLKKNGLARNIGTSNMTRAKMELLLRDCDVRPVCTEMELHPHFQQRDLFNYYMNEGIQVIGFCPIGSPNRPDRDKMSTDTVPIKDPLLLKIAEAHNVHPAVICIKWAVQNGQIPIPFSIKPYKFMANLACTMEDPLTKEEMAAINANDKNCRFIKGQVFCWQGAEWKDLWDEDGIITRWKE